MRVAGVEIPQALLLPLGFAVVSLAGQFAIVGGATASLATPLVVTLAALGFGLSLPSRVRIRGWWLADRRWRFRRLRSAVCPLRPDDLRRVHQARRHSDLSGDARPGDAARLPNRRPSAVDLSGDSGHEPGLRLSTRIPRTPRNRAKPRRDRTRPGSGSRTSHFSRRCSPPVSTSSSPESLHRDPFARLPPSLGRRRLCCTGTPCGVGSRRSPSRCSLFSSLLWRRCISRPHARCGGCCHLLSAAPRYSGCSVSAALRGSYRHWPRSSPLPSALKGGLVALRTAVVVDGATAVLSIPALVLAGRWLARSSGFTRADELGNLVHPLSWLQVFGIWLNGDFRLQSQDLEVTWVLAAVVIAAALVAFAIAMRRRAWELPIALATVAFACAVYVGAGSPWIAGKALASASPIVLAAAVAGAALVFESRPKGRGRCRRRRDRYGCGLVEHPPVPGSRPRA